MDMVKNELYNIVLFSISISIFHSCVFHLIEAKAECLEDNITHLLVYIYFISFNKIIKRL